MFYHIFCIIFCITICITIGCAKPQTKPPDELCYMRMGELYCPGKCRKTTDGLEVCTEVRKPQNSE